MANHEAQDEEQLFATFLSFAVSFHEVANELTRHAKAEGVTPLQYKLLEYVAINGSAILGDLSECLHMSMPNTSRELKKLIDKQLVSKEAAADDKRKQIIRLTARGKAMMDEAFRQIRVAFERRIAPLSPAERTAIEQALLLLHTKVLQS